MQKPNNYDNTQSGGEYTPITPGGHHLIIKRVEESKTKGGKDMIVIAFDTASGDSQPNFFSKEFADDIRPDKKWPRSGRQYIVVTDNDGNCSRSFKSFVTCVENSNNGFKTEWGDKFASQFKEKRIGGVFGIVESEYQGKRHKRAELRWFCADNKVEGQKVPDPKLLPNSNTTVAAPEDDGFMSISDESTTSIPF